MKRVVCCPWCYEPVVIDDRAALGCAAARDHVNRCEWVDAGRPDHDPEPTVLAEDPR